MSAIGEPISFNQRIKPLFRESDQESMLSSFDLWSHDDVARLSDSILARLRDGSMPCDGAWPGEQVALFQNWVAAGKTRLRAPVDTEGIVGPPARVGWRRTMPPSAVSVGTWAVLRGWLTGDMNNELDAATTLLTRAA